MPLSAVLIALTDNGVFILPFLAGLLASILYWVDLGREMRKIDRGLRSGPANVHFRPKAGSVPAPRLQEVVISDLDVQKNRLSTLLKTHSDLHFEPGEGNADMRLGPVTREFFSTCRRISTKDRGLELASDLISDSSYFEGCIYIGHYEYWEIVVRPGLDYVYVVDGSEDGLDATDSVYPTIYHYLVHDLQL